QGLAALAQVVGDHVVGRRHGRRHVHDPVDHDRRRLEAAELLRARLQHHARHQVLHVRRVDRTERRKPVVPVVMAVHEPVAARGGLLQHVARHHRVRRRSHLHPTAGHPTPTPTPPPPPPPPPPPAPPPHPPRDRPSRRGPSRPLPPPH